MRRVTAPVFAALFASCALASTVEADEVESPIYRSWANFKVGTTITLRSVTGAKDREVQTTTTQRLTESNNERVVLEVVVTSDSTGQKVENRPQTYVYKRMFPLFPGVKKEDIGKPPGSQDQGEETIELGGKKYKAQWYGSKGQTEAGPSISKTWMSDEVPGKLLKSITRVPAAGKTTTLELIEIKTP